MVNKLARTVMLALLLLFPAGFLSPAAADEPNHAGLVIVFDQDRVETLCIPLEGAEITGNELLARSGLDLVVDATSGLGITVCQIEGQGCSFPAEHCFCQCMGGEQCHYWNYFYREPGDHGWTYSPLGALLHKVRPGSVEAWVWGNGQTPPDQALGFEAICRPVADNPPLPTATGEGGSEPVSSPATATPTARATAPAAPSSTAPSSVASAPTESRTAAPSPTAQPTATPPEALPSPALDLSGYFPFGLLVLGLLLIGAAAWLRRR